MWYLHKLDGDEALLFRDEMIVVCYKVADAPEHFRQAYLAWVAEGNTAEEWQPE